MTALDGRWPGPVLLDRARALVADGTRRILGIAGPPGAGKSTLADLLVQELRPLAALAPMDGFHLRQAEIDRLGLTDRKGAPETFDVPGYVALLARVLAADEDVWAPAYDRSVEEPVTRGVLVPREARLVVAEGNYLLCESGGWGEVRPLLAECWYVETVEAVRRERLTQRHITHGKSPAAAAAWAAGSDELNAELVRGTRERADLVVTVPSD